MLIGRSQRSDRFGSCASSARLAALASLALNEEARGSSKKKKKKRVRRVVVRAEGGWKGSTMYGYTMDPANDDKTYMLNFRMSHETFAHVASLIEKSGRKRRLGRRYSLRRLRRRLRYVGE